MRLKKLNNKNITNHKIWIILALFLTVTMLVTACSFEKSSEPDNSTNETTTNHNSVSESSEPIATSDEMVDDDNETGEDGIQWLSDSTWVYVDNSWLNIRSGPSTDYAVITEVYMGQALERTAVSDYWSEIILPDGSTGYAYNSYLSLKPVDVPLEEVVPVEN